MATGEELMGASNFSCPADEQYNDNVPNVTQEPLLAKIS